LVSLLSRLSFSQSLSVPVSLLEEIRKEAALIRRESSALGALLSLQESESAALRSRLAEVEAALSEAESLLREASLSLEKSEAALIPLREELGKLGNELAVLRKQAEESNRRLTRSARGEKFWRAAAISAAAVFAAVEIGRILIK
jgi:chromosome segregation ATPase